MKGELTDFCIGKRMEIHLNMTFPRLPCELLTLDVMDVSGEQQVGVAHGVNKVRLSPVAEGGRVLDIQTLELYVSLRLGIIWLSFINSSLQALERRNRQTPGPGVLRRMRWSAGAAKRNQAGVL